MEPQTTRKLASIQEIHTIEPHPTSERHDIAHVLGWRSVVLKGSRSIGDCVVWIEADSIPPDCAPFTSLWGADGPRPNGFRIRSIKVKGYSSEGVAIPIAEFDSEIRSLPIGTDLTQALKITKWEPPAKFSTGVQSAPFPRHIGKTDELRLQAYPELLEELKGLCWYCSLKYDGTSSTFTIDPETGSFLICGRNAVMTGGGVYHQVAAKYGIETILRENPTYSIQGEVVGPKVQGNPAGLSGPDLRVFNIKVLQDGHAKLLGLHDTMVFCTAYGLPICEVIEEGDTFNYTADQCFELAARQVYQNGAVAEGLVWRPQIPVFSPTVGSALSFKTINPLWTKG